MPQVTVYIRNDDLRKWKSIEKKSEFIHKVLNVELNQYQKELISKVIKSKEDATKVIFDKTKSKQSFCKHGAAVGFCKFGCK